MTELQLILVGNVILLLLLCATVFGVNIKMADNTGFVQKQQAQDLALTVNAFKALPQAAQLQKPLVEDIQVKITSDPCRITTTIMTEKKRSPTQVTCNSAQEIGVTEKEGTLFLEKEKTGEGQE